MIYVLGIIPNVFEIADKNKDKERELDHVWSLFYENALLANLAGGYWIEQVAALRISSNLKDKIFRHLQKLRELNRIVDFPSSNKKLPKTTQEWIALAIQDVQSHKIDKIIIEEETRTKSKLMNDFFLDFPLEPFDQGLLSIQINRTFNFRRTYDGLHTALIPLLRYARKVIIIDPFINCTKPSEKEEREKNKSYYRKIGYKNSLEMCASIFHENAFRYADKNLSPCRIDVYSSEKSGLPGSKMNFRLVLLDFLQSIASKYDVTIAFHVLGKLIREDQGSHMRNEPHDRYILTDQFGVNMSNSINIEKEGDESNVIWQLLTESSWRASLTEYTISPIYTIKNSITVEP